MKKLSAFLPMSLVVLLTMTVTSCQSDDEKLAYYLDGVWSGNILSGSRTYDATIEFVQNDYYSDYGYGYEYDSGWQYGRITKTYFKWWVRNGNIYLEYEDAPGRYIVLRYNYLPTSNSLYVTMNGYFVDYDSGEPIAEFRLKKVLNHDGGYAKENKTVETEE